MLVSGPLSRLGKLVLNRDGSFTFQRGSRFRNQATFLFEIQDNVGGTSTPILVTLTSSKHG